MEEGTDVVVVFASSSWAKQHVGEEFDDDKNIVVNNSISNKIVVIQLLLNLLIK